MKIKQKEFDALIELTGAPCLNLSTRPRICSCLANWFFVTETPESETTRLVREYLLEIDSEGYVKWEKD